MTTKTDMEDRMDDEARWDGFIIMCDESVMDEAMMEAAEAWLDKHRPEYAWEFRYPCVGEAEGTYGKDDGQLPQILGCSIPVPEDAEQMIGDAINAAIDAVNA